MSVDSRSASALLESLLRQHGAEELLAKLAPKHHERPERMSSSGDVTAEQIGRRWEILRHAGDARRVLLDEPSDTEGEIYARNIENFVGTVRVPVGVAGPLRVNGTHAQGDYYVPMATTEATLVASYHRGASLLTECGGCAAVLVSEGLARAPGFAFATLYEAGQFITWAVRSLDALRAIAESTTRFGKLKDIRVTLEGNHVYLIFDYFTGDAAGQNMVTIATQAICEYIREHSPVKPTAMFVEANHSGDKKASAQSFLYGRGRSVCAEVIVPATLVETRLHTTAQMMATYWRMSAVGGVLSGTIGVQGHYANGLAAVYLACGQDVACVAESAVGVTRFELNAEGALYASVTLPNLVVGTVGGGTGLPSQRACLDILGLAGAGNANAFAQVCAAIALAGELSIVGALVAGDFTNAHARLARGNTEVPPRAQ